MAFPTITPLPTPPTRGDEPTVFANRADEFLGALPQLASQANVLAQFVNDTAASISQQDVLARLAAEIGSDLNDVSNLTIGDIFTAGSLSSGSNIYLSKPTTFAGLVNLVSAGVNGGGTGTIYLFVPRGDGTFAVAYVQNVTAGTGASTWLISGRVYLPAGSRVGYKRLTGGTPFYTSGGSTPYIPAASVAAVGDVTGTPTTVGITMSIQLGLTYAPTPLSSQISAGAAANALNAASILAILAASYPSSITMGDAAAAALTVNTSFCWGTQAHTVGGLVRQVRVQTVTGGIGKIVCARVAGSSITVQKSWTVTTTGGGAVDTFGAETLGTVFVPAGCAFFYVPVTSGNLRYNSGGTSYRFAVGADTSDGASIAISNITATVSMSATIGYAASAAIAGRPADKSLSFERQVFAGSVVSGGWAVSGWSWSNGLVATGAGWTNQATVNLPSVIANKVARAKVRLAAATDKVGLVFNCVAIGYGGAGIILNGAGGTLDIYSLDASNNATLAESVMLPPGFIVAGEQYTIEATKNRLTMSAKVTRSLTRQSAAWSRTFMATSDTRDLVRYYGAPGVVCLAGNPSVLEFDASATVRPQPHLLIIGDSIAEGSSMGVSSSSWQNSWTYLLDNARGRGDVVIGARGGDTTTAFLSRMAADLSIWQPKYCLIQMGTNDSSQAIWRSNMATIVAAVLATGAIPVLCTYIPRTGIAGIQDKLTAMNADVTSGYFGRYDWVDFAAAVSLNNDRVTIDPSLYSDGAVHPNTAGAAAMFAQIQADAPYLFD